MSGLSGQAPSGYRVQLDDFTGPMDLLVYLVHRQEVSIAELKVGELTAQYLTFMDQADTIDVNAAGDYLVMAAQLLQMKTRALLPPEEVSDDGGDDTLTRDSLIRGLLDFRRLQDESRVLDKARELADQRYGRTSERRFEDVPLRNVDVWDLVTAFRQLQEQLGRKERSTRIVEADDQPLYVHVSRLRDRLSQATAALSFCDLIDDPESRASLVASFLALLELIRLHEVRALQGETFGEIRIAPTTEAERAELRADDALDVEDRIDPGAQIEGAPEPKRPK